MSTHRRSTEERRMLKGSHGSTDTLRANGSVSGKYTWLVSSRTAKNTKPLLLRERLSLQSENCSGESDFCIDFYIYRRWLKELGQPGLLQGNSKTHGETEMLVDCSKPLSSKHFHILLKQIVLLFPNKDCLITRGTAEHGRRPGALTPPWCQTELTVWAQTLQEVTYKEPQVERQPLPCPEMTENADPKTRFLATGRNQQSSAFHWPRKTKMTFSLSDLASTLLVAQDL